MYYPTTNSPHLTVISTILLLTCGALGQQHPDGGGCIPAERDALLSFKKGVTITTDRTNRLSSWHGQDCCRWRGVRCSNETGHVLWLHLRNEISNHSPWYISACDDENALVGEISSSLLSLEQLEHIDLSGNCLLEYGRNIPSFLGSMKNLRYLNLSFIPAFGKVPPQFGNLSKLQYLDLGSDIFYSKIYSTDITWLKDLHFLQHLSMRGVNLSQISGWAQILNGVPSLSVIDFSGCSLESANQSLPYMNLTKLQKLDLSWNYFHHEIASCWFWKATGLKYLDLSEHRFFGEFHDALENMTSLQVLHFSYGGGLKTLNRLVMKGNYNNLCSLEILDLSYNLINGDINELMEMFPRCTRDKLQELQLERNNFTGTLANSIRNFTNLNILDLSGNNLIGSIPPELGYLSSLTTLLLAHNHLNGNIPTNIGALTNLTSLDLSNNNLNGIITEEHFAGLISLKKLNLASNNLKFVVGAHWFPPFTLQNARFASCPMGPLFPAWLQLQIEIIELDLSSNALLDKIPDWFWQTFSLATDIDISNNQLSGTLPAHLSDMALQVLNLSSNQLTGTIPQFPRNIIVLDISRNSFSGPLPSIEAPQLETLLMFSNQISGSIPESVCALKILLHLDLSSNALEGKIPHCLKLEYVLVLQLSNNSLSGYFPTFLRTCTHLVFLDLGWNKFFGSLPDWIGEVNGLQFLRLSHNMFSGNIPIEITNLNDLQYLDLSSNNMSGVIPCHLSNLTAMTHPSLELALEIYPAYMQNETGYVTTVNQFEDTPSTITKGQQLIYGKGLAYFVSIDLSANSLTGEIPLDITSLDALTNLNLSSNYLSGNLPRKIGAMQSLESLDLSKNKIFGDIPASLSNLTSLSYLNLSYNNLSGRIPTGRQLDTLNTDNPSIMYIGNSGLCGPPLQKSCSGNNTFIHAGNRSNMQDLYWMPFYLGLILGFVAGLWIVFCSLLLKKTWRISYFRLVDKLYDKVYVFVALRWARLSRNSAAK